MITYKLQMNEVRLDFCDREGYDAHNIGADTGIFEGGVLTEAKVDYKGHSTGPKY